MKQFTGSSGENGGYKEYEGFEVSYDFNIKYTGTDKELRDFILSLNGINGDILKLPDVTDYTEDYKKISDTEEF